MLVPSAYETMHARKQRAGAWAEALLQVLCGLGLFFIGIGVKAWEHPTDTSLGKWECCRPWGGGPWVSQNCHAGTRGAAAVGGVCTIETSPKSGSCVPAGIPLGTGRTWKSGRCLRSASPGRTHGGCKSQGNVLGSASCPRPGLRRGRARGGARQRERAWRVSGPAGARAAAANGRRCTRTSAHAVGACPGAPGPAPPARVSPPAPMVPRAPRGF